jgi:hypothetical protein
MTGGGGCGGLAFLGRLGLEWRGSPTWRVVAQLGDKQERFDRENRPGHDKAWYMLLRFLWCCGCARCCCGECGRLKV